MAPHRIHFAVLFLSVSLAGYSVTAFRRPGVEAPPRLFVACCVPATLFSATNSDAETCGGFLCVSRLRKQYLQGSVESSAFPKLRLVGSEHSGVNIQGKHPRINIFVSWVPELLPSLFTHSPTCSHKTASLPVPWQFLRRSERAVGEIILVDHYCLQNTPPIVSSVCESQRVGKPRLGCSGAFVCIRSPCSHPCAPELSSWVAPCDWCS